MSNTDDRASVIDKAKKIWALADGTSYEHERATAHERLLRFMAKHSITEQDLGIDATYFASFTKMSPEHNPFKRIRSEMDIWNFANTLVTIAPGKKLSEDFWAKAEAYRYSALVGYIWYELAEEQQTMGTLAFMDNRMKSEEKSTANLFEELETHNPEHYAVLQYKKHKLAARYCKPHPTLIDWFEKHGAYK